MQKKTNYQTVDSVETLEALLGRVREAQKKFATYSQEQVDKIFFAAASAANKARIPLAKLAVEETGLGRENLSATFEYLNLTLSAVSLTATSGRKENLVVGKRTHKVSARGNVEGLLAAVNVDFNSALRRDSCFYNQQDSHQNQDDDHHKRYS